MTDTTAARQRIHKLKQLREAHASAIEQTQAHLKEQKAIRRLICQVIRSDPKTVPEIAAAAGLPATQVLWHLTALKKYDLVREAGTCGEYFLYEMVREEGK